MNVKVKELTGRGAGLSHVSQGAVDWLLGLMSMLPEQHKTDFLSEIRRYHAFFYLSLYDVIYKQRQGKLNGESDVSSKAF